MYWINYWLMRNMQNYAVNFLAQMLKTYSPSGQEEKLADFLQREMKKLGFKVKIDRVGNVIGEIGKGRPVTLLCGHMDTVPGHIPVRMAGNKLFGRGAVDAKGSLAAMILGAKEFARKKKKGKVIVAGVVEEESASKGIKNLLKSRLEADFAIFGEPSRSHQIIVGYRGRTQLKINCKTMGGHAGAPWIFTSAVEQAYQIWLDIKNHQFKNQKEDQRFYAVSTCLTQIRGGEATNVVPSNCEMTIDVRVPPQLNCGDVMEEIRGILHNYEDKKEVEVAMEIEDCIEPFEVSVDSVLVKSLRDAIRKETKRPVKLVRKTGASDMNLFGTKIRIPMVAYGPGNPEVEHTLNEHIETPEYTTGIRILADTLGKLSDSFTKA